MNESQLGVLLERIEGKIDVVVEIQKRQEKILIGHGEKLDQHTEILNQHDRKINMLIESVADLTEGQHTIKQDLAHVNTVVDRIETKLDNHEIRITKLEKNA